MEHVAIMRKSWGLTKKILSGHKTIESRWYTTKRQPWGCINEGETVYFKDSGNPVALKATVAKVERYDGLTKQKVRALLDRMHNEDGIETEKIDYYAEMFRNKKYCMLIHLKDPQRVAPFNIKKKGFGMMAAWISIDKIDSIMIP